MSKKDKEIVVQDSVPMSAWLPKSLQNVTLNELIDSQDIEFNGGPGHLMIKREIDGNRVILRVDKQDFYSEINQFVVNADLPRDERDKAIQDLRDKHNLTQQEIANRMGISQSGVSQILRRNKDKK